MKHLLFLLFVIFCSISAFSQSSREYGIDLYRAGDFEKSAEVLKAVTTVDKKDQIAWVYLGASLYKSGKSKDAGSAFRKGKANIEDLVPGDDSPVSGFKKPRPHYTDMARQNLTSGVVKLAVEFGPDGIIGFVCVSQALPNGLTEESMAAARKITFTPATKNGKTVGTVAIVEYTFDIR